MRPRLLAIMVDRLLLCNSDYVDGAMKTIFRPTCWLEESMPANPPPSTELLRMLWFRLMSGNTKIGVLLGFLLVVTIFTINQFNSIDDLNFNLI